MYIEIKADSNVKKDRTKWAVYREVKDGGWKKIKGLSGSLKDDSNKTLVPK